MPNLVITPTQRTFDAAAVEMLKRAVDDAEGGASLVIDLSRVEYIDSRGLAALIALRRHARARSMVLAALRPFVARVVRAAQLTDYFDIVQTREAAHALLSA